MKKTNLACMFALSAVFLAVFSVIGLAATSDSRIISISLINQDPDPAIAGDVLEVRLGVENRGGVAAESMVLEIIPEYPFTMLQGESAVQKVGTIKAFQYDADMKIVKFKLKVDRDVTAGEYELKVKEYQEGKENIAGTRSLNIEVESKESAEVIYIDKVELIPGKITPMTFTVNNVGSAPLRELTFQWENEDDIVLPVGSDNTKYIKYIETGESAELKFDVIASANADPDLYKLDLTLTYNDPITGEEKEISTKAGIYVGGATDFDAAFSGVSNGEASFSISNIGSVSASSVTVKIPEQQGWKVSGSNSVIIGNLNEGDYTIAGFKLQQAGAAQFQSGQAGAARDAARNAASAASNISNIQKQGAADDSTVNLEIIYTDSRGNRNTIKKEVPVDPSAFRLTAAEGITTTTGVRTGAGRTAASQSGGYVKWVIGAAAVLIIYLGYRKHRKEKIKDNGYTYITMLRSIFKLKKKNKSNR